ncbi:MAG: hypothetical protein ACFFD1_10990, partial [Candidatus Thorarchaeota archaeon]
MNTTEITKFRNILQFFDDGVKNKSDFNCCMEWIKNFPREIFEFKSLCDKFAKELESLERKENFDEKKKNNELKEYLINISKNFDPYPFKIQEGNNYLENKEYDKAIESWRQIPADHTLISQVYLNIGVAFIEKNNDEEALEWFIKSYQVKQDPKLEQIIFYIQF